ALPVLIIVEVPDRPATTRLVADDPPVEAVVLVGLNGGPTILHGDHAVPCIIDSCENAARGCRLGHGRHVPSVVVDRVAPVGPGRGTDRLDFVCLIVIPGLNQVEPAPV